MRTRFCRYLVGLSFLVFFFSGQAVALAGELLQGYRVTAGDTLWWLGQRYGTSAAELTRLNGLTEDKLSPGQFLYLPVRLQEQGIMYWVQPGDTFYLIGQRTGHTAAALQELNGISGDGLRPGQQIFLPLTRPQTFAYTVRPGDTLFLLSRRFGIEVAALKQANSLPGDELRAGQIILVPQGLPAPPASGGEGAGVTLYRVQSGDTLGGIALRYATSTTAIYATNHLHSDVLMPGQPLYLPAGSKEPVAVAGPQGEQIPGFGELLDWEWARWIYNVGAVATVVDLATREQFQVRHLGGSNHADSEPLTAADTATMLRIFGGRWSWAKRPILVQVGDRVVAASMAGMPHDVQTIADNNFPGHFDIYFWNSRSHNTNQLDPEHQQNVLRAAGKD